METEEIKNTENIEIQNGNDKNIIDNLRNPISFLIPLLYWIGVIGVFLSFCGELGDEPNENRNIILRHKDFISQIYDAFFQFTTHIPDWVNTSMQSIAFVLMGFALWQGLKNRQMSLANMALVAWICNTFGWIINFIASTYNYMISTGFTSFIIIFTIISGIINIVFACLLLSSYKGFITRVAVAMLCSEIFGVAYLFFNMFTDEMDEITLIIINTIFLLFDLYVLKTHKILLESTE